MEVAALIIGLVLVAVAVATLLRALTATAAQSAEVIESIATYGFPAPADEPLQRLDQLTERSINEVGRVG